jgi:hypothetical protein
MRIALSVGLGGSDTGVNPSDPCIATIGSVVRIAIGLPLRSAFLTQSRNMFAFRPRARATAAIDTPGCWHAPTASALNIGLWRRRRRLPVSITARSEVDTCTPNAKVTAHPCTRAGTLKDDFGGRLHFIRKRINSLIDVDFVILTLGLVEAWFDSESGLHMNTTPSPEIMEEFPTRFRFRVLSEADVVECVS